MITEIIESLDTNFIIPSEKELDSILKKIKKGKKLSFEDNLTLSKMRFCKMILDKDTKKIKF